MNNYNITGAIVPVLKQPYEMGVMYASMQLDEPTLLGLWAEGREMNLDQLLAEPMTADNPLAQTEGLNSVTLEPSTQKAPEEAISKVKSPKPGNNSKSSTGLTGRELEVLRHLAAGMSNAEIGQELSLSTLTINTYLRTIYSKLEVSSRNAATRVAFDIGLLKLGCPCHLDFS